MNPDLIVGVTLPCMFGWFAWIIFSTFRRYKIARLQADVQSRLLEKIGSGQDLLAYAQTEAGRQLLESLQAGIVLFFFGSALLWLRSHVSVGNVDGFTIFGALSIAAGIGFGLSAAASDYLSRSFGLINGTRA
jgi:hypothetical protein